MVYVPAEKANDGVAKVIYTSKDRKTRKVFTALDWLARLVTHIPGRYEHTVRYYSYFSNKSRGMRKKADVDDFEIIDKILKHLDLWDIRNHDPPEVVPVYA